jgi:H+/Cl- antiporter ClcA
VPGIVLAALGTLGFGAVLGPEAPVIALGSAVGVAATLLVRLDQRGDAVISTAGSASAISALFGGPLVAGMLMTEGGLAMGAGLLPALIPGFVAAAVGYLIFTGFGNWGGLNAPGLLIPNLPAYSGVHLLDLLVAVVVGVLAALVINGVHRLAAGVDRLVGRLTMPGVLLGGGLAVGLLAEAVSLLGANSQDELFSGQSSIPALVSSGSFKIVLILVVFKSLGYAVSLGCGFRGGPIFPAIFLGVGLASISVVWFGVSPTLAIAIGTAAGMAAQTRLILSGLVFALLLVGSGGFAAIPAAVLAAVAAWLTASALVRPAEPGPASAGSRSPG